MLEKFQEDALNELAKNGGFRFTEKWFPYTSNWVGPYYVQSTDIFKTGNGYRIAIHAIMSVVEQIMGKSDKSIDVISGGETRDWPFAFPIAERLGLAPLMIYKNGKMLGPDIKDQRIIHVADLNNEGSSPRDLWVPAIRKAGGIINDIVFLVDRLEDGVEEMKKLGLNSHAVIPLNEESWIFLKVAGFVGGESFNSLIEYWRDRKAWGKQKLLEYPELLIEILQKDKEKGLKIFNNYYPLGGGRDLLMALGFNSIERFKEKYY